MKRLRERQDAPLQACALSAGTARQPRNDRKDDPCRKDTGRRREGKNITALRARCQRAPPASLAMTRNDRCANFIRRAGASDRSRGPTVVIYAPESVTTCPPGLPGHSPPGRENKNRGPMAAAFATRKEEKKRREELIDYL